MTWRRAFSFVKLYPELLVFNGFLLFKVVLFSLDMGSVYATLGMIVSTAALLLGLSGWLLMLPLKSRILSLFAFDLLMTLVLLSDSLYFTFFDRVIPYPVLQQTGAVGELTSSLTELVSTADILLFADFLFLVPFAWMLKNGKFRFRFKKLNFKSRVLHATTLSVLSLSVLALNTISLAQANGTGVFQDLYTNETVLRKMGVLNYHVADLYNNLGGEQKLTSEQAVANLQAWMNQHRKEGTHNLQGVAKGLNVIMIQMEALQADLINQKINGQEITPNLNKLIKRSLYFDNYFPQTGDGNTSDAEFMSLNSLYPLPAGNLYMTKNQNTYQSLPKLMKEAGYATYAIHNFKRSFFERDKMYQTEGFDHFISAESLKIDEQIGWGLTDVSMYRQALPIIKSMKQPAFSFLINLTGHFPYYLPMYEKKLNLPDDGNTLFNNYVQVQNYADRALGNFIGQLEQQGLMDKTLLVIYGDHNSAVKAHQFAKAFDGNTKLLERYQVVEKYKVPLIIHFPGDTNKGINHTQGGQVDLYPTLANLLNLNKSHMFYFGQDLLNAQEGFTALRHRFNKGTFLTNELFYDASNDGIFEKGVCYQRGTGQQLNLQVCAPGYKKANWHFEMSDLIHESNNLPLLLQQKPVAQQKK